MTPATYLPRPRAHRVGDALPDEIALEIEDALQTLTRKERASLAPIHLDVWSDLWHLGRRARAELEATSQRQRPATLLRSMSPALQKAVFTVLDGRPAPKRKGDPDLRARTTANIRDAIETVRTATPTGANWDDYRYNLFLNPRPGPTTNLPDLIYLIEEALYFHAEDLAH